MYRRHTYSDFEIFGVETTQLPRNSSYCFMNTSDRDIAMILIVSPVSPLRAEAASVRFTIPPGSSVCKQVGLGKDVSRPV